MDSFTQFDGNLLIGIQHALNADWLTPIMKSITMLGEDGIFWILVCLVLLLFKRTRRLGVICSLSLLCTFIVCNLCLKPAVDRVRPWITFQLVNPMLPPPGDASFPSGHSANSMGPAWAMFLATMPVRMAGGRSYDKVRCLGWNGEGVSPHTMHKFGIAAVVLAVLIGISRLYLGMHYPSDVVCGLLIGMIVATVVYRIILRAEDKRGMMDNWLSKENKKEK
ncbi:MAG: phosphatase PAP2 family protein [Mogibacterium sp.]|nr:phosphatase PAP2 family protein [Mogibacterium sp.]